MNSQILERLTRNHPESLKQSAIRLRPSSSQSAIRKRPQLFTLMLAAFALVIALGVGGTVGLYSLALGGQTGISDATAYSVQPGALTAIPPFKLSADGTLPRSVAAPGSSGDVVRGLVSVGLALAAVLLGGSAVFSRRISKPITRLTLAARTMAAGDLSVRVAGYGVREINDLAEAFNSMAYSIAEADSQRRQLTADVAHELRTPLSILKGRLEGMQDGVYPTTPDQIALLLSDTAPLERLIEDLRLLAQADAGQLPLYPEHFYPLELLEAVDCSFAPQAQAAGVSLRLAPRGDLPELYADPQRLSQVLGNLVSNALRYTLSGGTITLWAWTSHDTSSWLNISVQDTGAGIAPEDLPHIFDRFWKADKARSRSTGAGLGLAIARRIVEAHNGRIWATSTPGQSTTVGFALPVLGGEQGSEGEES